MKLFRTPLLLALAAVATCLAPAASWAQDIKPVAVVSIASIEEILADIGYLTVTAGMEDAGKTARLFGSALTAGLDKKRPLGMYVVPKDGDFHAVAFLPVSDLKQLLEIHKEYIGEPRDAGNGVLEIGMGKSAFIKEQKGWAFVAESAEHLTGLPQDPAALLADLPKQYNIAAKVLVQNIPQELKQTALDEIKFGLERALDAQAEGGAEVDKESVEQAAKSSLAGIEQILNDGDEFVVGWAVDAAGKKTHLDILITAKEGTDLARQMALNAEAKSSFTGMLLPEASVTMNFSAKLSESDIAQMQSAFKTLRDQSAKKIAEDPNLTPEQQKVASELVGKLLTVFEDTAKTGKLDGGAALILAPKSLSMVGGGYVADGAAFEQSLKELVDLAKNEPNFPEVKLNAGTHGNVKLHKVAIPIPAKEEEARDILGDKLEIVIGTGPKAVYVSAGKNAEALLKKVIDQSAQAADKAVPTMQLNVSVLPILKFFASVDENPMLPGLIASLEKSGNDKVVVSSQGGQRSSTVRIEIQEGLIRLIGEPLKQALGGQGPGAP
ncbi:MAG: hypothetical protein WD872_12945 [Pirellulaceae bacterium]